MLPVFAASQSRVPRVGLIKDYPATGLTVGCGNIYSELPGTVNNSGDKYVFLSRGDGGNAWMNLDGRDTNLRLMRTETDFSSERITNTRHIYRAGRTRIAVNFRHLDELQVIMTIDVLNGTESRSFRAISSSDC
jgi:hypothetical protein